MPEFYMIFTRKISFFPGFGANAPLVPASYPTLRPQDTSEPVPKCLKTIRHQKRAWYETLRRRIPLGELIPALLHTR